MPTMRPANIDIKIYNTDLLREFSRQRYLGLYDKNEVECSIELDLAMQYQSE